VRVAQRRVKQLYAPQVGGDPAFWRLRPLNSLALEYAAMDVHLLLKLHHALDAQLSPQVSGTRPPPSQLSHPALAVFPSRSSALPCVPVCRPRPEPPERSTSG
jgi:hypothetical protein